MFAIYRKEMRSYFINPIGYVYLGIFLVFSIGIPSLLDVGIGGLSCRL